MAGICPQCGDEMMMTFMDPMVDVDHVLAIPDAIAHAANHVDAGTLAYHAVGYRVRTDDSDGRSEHFVDLSGVTPPNVDRVRRDLISELNRRGLAAEVEATEPQLIRVKSSDDLAAADSEALPEEVTVDDE